MTRTNRSQDPAGTDPSGEELSVAEVVTATVIVGAKGRVVLPSPLRRVARISEGSELVARFVGEGRILLETRDTVRARVWDAAPPSTQTSTTVDVRSMRDEDIAIEGAHTRQAPGRPAPIVDPIGAALLERLGL
jgi:bifunctional DNA-binding transcriptional regulator/antitoxin component of YhaV-PrlF toxin-antitoxin module